MALTNTLRLLRVKQWTKNLFVFAAFLFGRVWTDPNGLKHAILAFFAMCSLSSATYIYNDLRDKESDKNHPSKSNRPIASGWVSPGTASTIAAGLVAVAALLGLSIHAGVLWPLFTYAAIQIVYNHGCRSVPVLDVFCIAAGFVTRVVVGAIAVSAPVSGWILLCTATLAMLLGFSKRRHEFLVVAGSDRPSLSKYAQSTLDHLLIFSAGMAAICYAIYSLLSPTAIRHPGLIMSTPFVLYGMCRYLLLSFSSDKTGEPESVLLTDPHIVASVLGFLTTSILALSGVSPPFIFK
jgi:4-hydroxybenzoate polyprenyltransferase